MKYENVEERNLDLTETYNVVPVGWSSITYAGCPMITSLRGFPVHLWAEGELSEWKKTWQRWLRLNKLLDALLEQPLYIITRIELQKEMVLIHRDGHQTDVFMLPDGGNAMKEEK
jgi:hypothetical protein